MNELLAMLVGEPWSVHDGSRFVQSGPHRLLVDVRVNDDDSFDLLLTGDVPTLSVVDGSGEPVTGEDRRAGQRRYRRLAGSSWTFSEPAGDALAFQSAPLATITALLPRTMHRIDRLLPAAAATDHRVVEATLSSADGRFVTEVLEDGERRMQLTVRSAEPMNFLELLRFRWALASPNGVSATRTLVLPIAPRRPVEIGVSHYDLGPLGVSSAILVEPAETVSAETITEGAIDDAFSVLPRGSAVRAWRALLALNVLPPGVQLRLTNALGSL